MIKKLALPLIIVLAAAAGGGGGYFAKTTLARSEHEAARERVHGDEGNPDHENSGETEKQHGKKSKGHGAGAAQAPSYMKFSRQFVVPIVENGEPVMMMIFDINIGIDDALAESVYQFEPQLRDAILQGLLTLSSDGVLINAAADANAMAIVKSRLLQIVQNIAGDGATQVLILDIGLQSY